MRYIVQKTGTQVKYGDDSDVFQFELWEGPSNVRTVEDAIVDLTGSIVTVDIANDSGFVGRFVTTTVPEKGIVNVDMSNEVITALPADTYYFQVEVDNGTKKKIFPTDGGDIIKIFKSLTEVQGELVPRTTIDDVLNKVDEKIAEYTSTIAKGDKGDKGDMDLSQITVGGRNYILKSKRVLDTQDPSAQHNGNSSWWDTGWVDTSIPISDFSNKVLTLSIQADYDNVAAANSGARVGIEIVANEVKPDGSIKARYIGNWRYVKQGDSFHGRFSTTVDLRGVVLASIYTPNHWGQGLYINGVTDAHVSISNPKIEFGNVATDWTSAPEDAPSNDAQLVHKTGDTMTGNLTAPQVIATDLLTGFHNVIQVPTNTTKIIDLINNEFINGRGFWKEATYIAFNTTLSDAPTNDVYSIIKLATRGVNRTYVEYSDLSGNMWHTTATTNTLNPWVKQANDSEVVHKTGTETVAGDKTFTGNIKFSGSVNAGYLDQLTTWETPVQVPITMTGPFASSDSQGYITYQGSLISFNFGGQIGSVANIGAGDLVIGQIPSGVPLPIATIRGFINDVSSSKAPTGAIRLTTGGSISMNLGDAYTPATVGEYWEMSATGFTKAVFAPLANSSYQNVVRFSPTTATQGAAFTKDYYFAMAVNSTDAGLVVYDRNKQTSQLVSFSNGPSNSGFTGHANDLAVLQDNSATNGSIWIGASHLYSPGMPIISYNPADGTVTKRGSITFTTDESTPNNLIISTIIHVDMTTSEIIVSANGKYWKGNFDQNNMANSQNITVTEVGVNMLSASDYADLIGSTLSNMLSVGQADWLEGDKFYKVRTATTSTTLSVVIEFTMVNKTPKPTGRYWMTSYPSWANNEIEKVWVENGTLYANINRNNVGGSTNIVAKLGDL